ncbi:MAG: DNA repair protein RadA [Alphaproteobacteria bacterium]|nr:DNA repair protein RadA [Alphaproteobacteria bacterium]
MARQSNSFVCQSCGATYPKWTGRCDACGEWNSLEEETATAAPAGAHGVDGGANGRALELSGLDAATDEAPRRLTGNKEFDRACGGGLVPGSALLIGGDPGVGKSTLLLQVAAGAANAGARVVYVSGEEAIAQISMRASRLGLSKANVGLAAATSLRDILATLKKSRPDIVVIDSIQTLWSDTATAAPGTVTQVRACAQELIRFAKNTSTTVILVGHVTKDGQIAGPRVVEHMVDAVLYFESEATRSFRLLRAVKNRFGPAHELGVFEMGGGGLREVANPSSLFLSAGETPAPGAAVFAGIEGTRPILVEFQALVSPSSLATPRRAVVGWDSARLSMLLAVLDARCGLGLGKHDVFLNVAGGLRIVDPAADLAAAAALCSSLFDAPLPSNALFFGEVALSGAVRPAAQADARLQEGEKLGFKRALAPAGPADDEPQRRPAPRIRLDEARRLADLVNWVRRIPRNEVEPRDDRRYARRESAA